MKFKRIIIIVVTWHVFFLCQAQQSFSEIFEKPQSDDYSLAIEELNGNYFVSVSSTDSSNGGYFTSIYKINGSGSVTDSLFLDSCFTKEILTCNNKLYIFSRKYLIPGNAEAIDIRGYDENFNLIVDTCLTQADYHFGFNDAVKSETDSFLVSFHKFNYTNGTDNYYGLLFLNEQLQFITQNIYPVSPIDSYFSRPSVFEIPSKNLIILSGLYISTIGHIVYKIKKDDLQLISIDSIHDINQGQYNCFESIVLFDSIIIMQGNIDQIAAPYLNEIGIIKTDTSFTNNIYKSFNTSGLDEKVAFKAIDKTILNEIYIGGTLNKIGWGGGVFDSVDRWITVFKTDTSGQTFWSKNIGGDADYLLFHLKTTSDNGVLLVATKFDWHNSLITQRDVCVYKLDAQGNFVFVSEIPMGNKNELIVYPNPATETISFQLKNNEKITGIEIFDITGKKVYVSQNEKSDFSFDVSRLKSGIYLYYLQTESNFYKGKFVINK